MSKWLVPKGAITIDVILLFYNYKKLKKSRFSGDHFHEKSMYNDTAKKNVWKPKSEMGQTKKVCITTPQKKNVWKLKSKMGQPKKVCITTPQKRTYGSLKVKWDNQKKLLLLILLFYNYKKLKKSRFSGDHFPEKCMYNDTAKKKNVWKLKSKMGQTKKVCITTPQKRTYGSPKVKWDNRKSMYNDTAKKNVWKPKSKMGQPKKVAVIVIL